MKKLLYNTMKKLLLIICFLIISFQAWGAMTDIPILIPGLSGTWDHTDL